MDTETEKIIMINASIQSSYSHSFSQWSAQQGELRDQIARYLNCSIIYIVH